MMGVVDPLHITRSTGEEDSIPAMQDGAGPNCSRYTFPMEAQMGKVIYEEYTGTQIPSSWVVHQPDDAWHPLKDKYYIEWWYFDLITGDGSIV